MLSLSIPSSNESEPSSLSSSLVSSPVGQGVHPYNFDSKPKVDSDWASQPKDVYDTSLSWWRAAIRRRLVARVRLESRVIARMQVSYSPLHGSLAYIYRLSINPFHIGKATYSMARRLFRLHFLPRNTYILHDRSSSNVFLWTS